jgi:hypothetical protein
MAKRSDINFVGGAQSPLQQLASYALGGPVASVSKPSSAPVAGNRQTVQSQPSKSDNKLKGSSPELAEGGDSSIAKGILGHIAKNALTGASLISPVGIVASLGLNQVVKSLTGGTPSEWISGALMDAFGAETPAGYTSRTAKLADNSILNNIMGSPALNQAVAVGNSINAEDTTTTGYGSGNMAGGIQGGGGLTANNGYGNNYGQGGSYGGGGI